MKLPKTCVSALILMSVLRVKPFKQVSCSPLGIPGIRDAVGHGYRRLFFVFFPLTFLSLRYSSTSSTPSICCCCSPFSSHSFQMSLNTTLPSYFWFPRFPFPSSFWAFDLFANFSLHLPFFPHSSPKRFSRWTAVP